MPTLFRPAALLATLLLLAGCTTTEDAQRAVASRWPGQPVDSFFSAYGPPVSSYKLSGGRTLYTWRGGRMDKSIPPDYRIVRRDPFYDPMLGPGFGPRFGPWYDDPQMVMVSPGRDVRLQCEAQITVDKARIVEAISLSGDTRATACRVRAAPRFSASGNDVASPLRPQSEAEERGLVARFRIFCRMAVATPVAYPANLFSAIRR